MDLVGKAKRVRIYVSEGDLAGHQPLEWTILDFLRRENASGATALRAVEGLTGSGQIRTTRVVDIQVKLPIVIEWVDRPDLVELLLPRLKEIAHDALITVDETDVVQQHPTPVHDVSRDLTAGEVMTADVVTVHPETLVREVVELVLGKSYRAVPVIDEARKPVGIITNSDLVQRGGLSVRVELLPSLDTPAVHAELERLASNHKIASEIMTPNPVTVPRSAPLTHVAEIMARRRLKRLPVVDESGALAGIISRIDLLRTVAGAAQGDEPAPSATGLNGDTPLNRVMRRDVAAVHGDTPLAEVMQAVVSTRLNRAIVVDADRHVVGVVSDAALLDRVTPALHPSALRTIMHRLPFTHPDREALEAEHHAVARTAGDLMETEVPTAFEDTPLRDAIAVMLHGAHKVIAVVDQDSRLVGIVDRADILHGLVAPT